MSAAPPVERPVKSLIPVRMDRMPWSKFHWLVIVGLGTAWILDGLEIQLVASAGYAKTLGMSSAQVGLTSTIYLLGQVTGALIFGRVRSATPPDGSPAGQRPA
jgi:MFS family permease